MTAVGDVQMMRALGAVADEVVRTHGHLGGDDLPDLAPGLTGEPRGAVFDYIGLSLPEDYRDDLAGHARVREASRSLVALAGLAEVVDAAWNGDDAALRGELVELGADVIRWIQAIDRRTEAGPR